MIAGRTTSSLISATAAAPPAEAAPAAAANTQVARGIPTWRTSVMAADAVPVTAATLFVANTAAAGIPVADMSTGMSTSPPPPMTASTQPATAAATVTRTNEVVLMLADYPALRPSLSQVVSNSARADANDLPGSNMFLWLVPVWWCSRFRFRLGIEQSSRRPTKSSKWSTTS